MSTYVARRSRLRTHAAIGALCVAMATTAAAAEQRTHDFNIPREGLSKALRDYGRVSGRQLIFTEDLVAGKTAPALKGSLGPDEALRVLLTDTGLTFQRTQAGAVMIERSVQNPELVGEPKPLVETSEVEGLVVTATRVARAGYSAPTPTTVLGAEELERMAAPNVADSLNRLPALRATLTPTTTARNSNLSGGNYLDLRGLGANRTLVLVDGKRFVSSVVDGPTDINVVPQALIGSIDIVTGGASAAYGSDAVAGVVNLRFNHSLQGFKGTVQGGVTDHNDHRNYLGSFAYGTSFLDDRGKLLLAAEAAQNTGVPSLYDREWGRAGRGVVANPAYTATNAEPRNLLVTNARRANTSYGGVINSGPLKGLQFAPNGSAVPFTYGSLVTTRTMVGGDGADPNATQLIETPSKRKVGYGLVSYEFSRALTAYAEGSWAQSDNKTLSTTREDTAILVQIDNPFLQQAVRDMMVAKNVKSFTLGRYNKDYGTGRYDIRNKTGRGVFGLKGELPSGWSWDAYYTHGDSKNRRAGENVRNTVNYNLAVDAATDPATGAAVCRNVAARAAGCVPLNIFGDGAPSAQALAYVTGNTSLQVMHMTQDVAAATIRGEPFQTWAGPASFAGGVEYRRDSAAVTSDILSATFVYATGNSVPWSGSVKVKEAFAELVLPLAKDAAWARSLDLNLAGRITDYSTSGTVETWKAGATWDVNDVIRFRATWSRDIRAASLSELYAGAVISKPVVFDPVLNQTYEIRVSTQGDSRLRPEKARTLTAGVILNNLFFDGFRASVDYYDIKLNDAIAAITFDSIVDRCTRDRPELCSLITRTNGQITQVQTSPQNLQSVQVRGVDFEAGYTTNLAAGTLSLRGIVSYLDRLSYDDGQSTTVLDGSLTSPFFFGTNGQPHWRGFLSATYQVGPATAYLGGRYISSAKFNNLYTSKDLDKLSTPHIIYMDSSLTYRVREGRPGTTELFVSVQNMFNVDPPITDAADRGTSAANYDMVGRTYTGGVRFKF